MRLSLVVGSGSLEENVNKIISNSDYKDKIVLLGRVEDFTLAELYENALAVVIPSTWPENCPLVALESLSYGKPFIAFNTGGIPEIVKKSEAGVAVETIEEFINEMIKISNNQQLRNSMMNNANEAYGKYYSPDGFMKDYINLLDL